MAEDQFVNLQSGTIVNGRYEIVRCLGTGSMGLVYACRHLELGGHLVAMKVLFSEVAQDETAAARFRNEIVASYGVNHPNVVRAYEYFRDGALIAFTMEFVGGGDLADLLEEKGFLDLDEVVDFLSQMASGVSAIHSAGIVHRDLKPENILLTKDNKVKITDFGIARTDKASRLTEHGGVVGTIDYVSPEYLEQGQVDARSDIYALGILGYEMIAGNLPFEGRSVVETMTLRLKTEAEPVHLIRTECPKELSKIISRAMAKDPDLRYQTAGEMLKDIEKFKENFSKNPSKRTAREDSQPIQSMREVSPTEEIDAAVERDRKDTLILEEQKEKSDVYSEPLPDTLEMNAKMVDNLNQEIEKTSRSLQDLNVFAEQKEKFEETIEEDSQFEVNRSGLNLSSSRIRDLSKEFYIEDRMGWKTLLKVLIVLIIGTGVALSLLYKFQPKLFSADSVDVEQSYYIE